MKFFSSEKKVCNLQCLQCELKEFGNSKENKQVYFSRYSISYDDNENENFLLSFMK